MKLLDNIMEDAIPEKLPILGKETDIQFQEAPRVPNGINLQRTTSTHTVIKMYIKDKEGILKQQEKCSKLPTREIQLGYQLTSQQTCCRPQGRASGF